ncbi:hypothetical protein BD626DRAFT_486097 [Schizophyllum amplum]|uniref:Cleavage stimulation factor subunit 2 hinge domain-containing protein n=1 Tax=Schizophyllum amplum TaxID=97359 RepID=A0A550CM62_9AGAR|nr:hypothetical protein BD626DRAFT_486097 [Auriculariopsis ampla]
MSSNQTLATEQLLELLMQLKKTTPDAARQILNAQPQIAYALITLMVSMNAIDIEVFQRTLTTLGPTGMGPQDPIPPAVPPVASAIPPYVQPHTEYRTTTPPYAPQPQAYANGQAPTPQAYTNPAASGVVNILASIPDDQKALVVQLLSMTPEQISALPPNERANVMQLRATLGLP